MTEQEINEKMRRLAVSIDDKLLSIGTGKIWGKQR
jgi:hypothetical protein